MGSNLRPCKRLLSFSERIAASHRDKGSLLLPAESHGHFQQTRVKSQGSTNSPYHLFPDDSKESHRQSLTRPPDRDLEPGQETQCQDPSNFHLLSTWFIPTFVVCVTVALLSAALLAIVYLHKVDIRPNIFNPARPHDGRYVLVDFPGSEYCRQARWIGEF